MVRINAVLTESIIHDLDRLAHEESKSRSALLREAAEKLLAERRRMQEEERRKAKVRQAMALQDRLRRKSAGWDGISVLRQNREARS